MNGMCTASFFDGVRKNNVEKGGIGGVLQEARDQV